MSGVFRGLYNIFFDFKKDVTDLSEKLDLAEATERRLVSEATKLHQEIERLRKENSSLKEENKRLSKLLEEDD